jgi:hypothetical protein
VVVGQSDGAGGFGSGWRNVRLSGGRLLSDSVRSGAGELERV